MIDESTQKIKSLSRMKKEDVFGDISFLFGSAAGASVIADSDQVELYCWEKKILEQIFVEKPYLSPKFYFDISIRISNRWTAFIDRNLEKDD
jgi:CRP-like cAMP-binding protein